MGDVVRDAAEDEAAGAGHALVADHDQVRLDLFGGAEDRLGGVAFERMRGDLDPLLAGLGGGGVEDEVDVLARADLVLNIRRSIALLVFDLALGDRGEGASLGIVSAFAPVPE